MICDLNEGRGKIDFEKFSKNVDFTILRASCGLQKDARYDEYASECERYEIPYHAFHYLKAVNEVKARTEAKFFAQSTEAHRPLFYVIDCEYRSIKMAEARKIVDTFEDALRHYVSKNILVAVYIAHELYKSWNLDYEKYAYVWIPRYGRSTTGKLSDSIKPDYPCDLWQYTENGKVDGVNAKVDLDVLNGNKPISYFTRREGGDSVTKRMPAKDFVKELYAAYKRGDGYIMGSRGENPRTGYLDLSIPESQCRSSWKESGYYFKGQYSGSQLKQALEWRKKCTRVWDCNGMSEGIYEIFSGVNINTRARHAYANWCSIKGRGIIPAKYRIPGAAVYFSNNGASSIHHVAYLYKPVKSTDPSGDWYLIEASGVLKGVVKSKLLSRKPNFWGLMDKYYDYGDITSSITEEEVVEVKQLLGSRTLKNGSEGEDVKEMQSGLIRLGYDLGKWGADGDFGDCTEEAVRAFQVDHKIKETGKFDSATFKVFEPLISALNGTVDSPKYVVIEGGKCNIRKTPGLEGKQLGVAHEGDKYDFGGSIDEETGWLSIKYKDSIAWVSCKYGRLSK